MMNIKRFRHAAEKNVVENEGKQGNYTAASHKKTPDSPKIDVVMRAQAAARLSCNEANVTVPMKKQTKIYWLRPYSAIGAVQ